MNDHTQESLPKEQRYHQLDSLRGIAAFTVVLLHFQALWSEHLPAPHGTLQKIVWKLAQPLYAGGAAVYVFFVLSGFVLALPRLRGKREGYLRYALRRILRIYGPYLVAITLAILLDSVFYKVPLNINTWSAGMWREPPRLQPVLQHLLLIGYFDSKPYDFVIWTLVQEMRLSLLFPLLFAAVSTAGIWALPGLLTVLFLASIAAWGSVMDSASWNVYLTGMVASYFGLGTLLAMYSKRIRAVWSAHSAIRLAVPAVGVLLFGFSLSSLELSAALDRILPLGNVGHHVMQDFAYALAAACCIISGTNSGWMKRLLENRSALFLGKISYSLYLVHPLVLLTIPHFVPIALGVWLQMAVYLVVSIFCAWLLCLTVEEPLIALSRRISRA